MADYWIKLYLEILDDSKMAVLPDRLWRRVIELFLLAGRYHKEGNLPETRQLAWVLRFSVDDLEMELQQIASTGIIQKTVEGWYIPKFAQRQAAVPGKERTSQFRKREQQQQYYDNVTEQKRNVTQIQINRLTDTDTDTDTDKNSALDLDPFEEMKALVAHLTGYDQLQPDIVPLIEFIDKGVIEEDIKNALIFLDGKKQVRGAADLRNSVMVARGKRIQGGNGRRKEQYTGPNGEVIEL